MYSSSTVLKKNKKEMSMQPHQIKNYVHQVIKKEIINDVLKFILKKKINLWGYQKDQRNFKENMLYVSLYKDIVDIGYGRLFTLVSFLNISQKSLRHNVKQIRFALKDYADLLITLGDVYLWNRSMSKVKKGKKINDANLMIDSSDFKITGKSNTSTKSSTWSWKENGPAQRFWVVYDGKGKVRRIWGGSSPKIYDSDFIKLTADYIDKELDGAVILADNHFSEAQKYLSNVKFYSRIADYSSKRNRDGSPISTLTRDQQKFNEQLSQVRGKVETPFGFLKNKFSSLNLFREEKQQLDCLVRFGLAINNMLKK